MRGHERWSGQCQAKASAYTPSVAMPMMTNCVACGCLAITVCPMKKQPPNVNQGFCLPPIGGKRGGSTQFKRNLQCRVALQPKICGRFVQRTPDVKCQAQLLPSGKPNSSCFCTPSYPLFSSGLVWLWVCSQSKIRNQSKP